MVLAALISAALHAAWNAALRTAPDPATAFGAMVISAGVWASLALPFVGLPSVAVWPWFAASVVLNVIAMRLLVAAYARASFAIAYPIARGLYPPLLIVPSIALFGEVLSMLAFAGLALVSVAILLLLMLARDAGPRSTAGVGFAVLAAAVTAGYVACDVAGARSAGSMAAYAFTISVANGIIFGALLHFEGRHPLTYILKNPGFAFGWSLVSNLSYLLVLYAFTVAPAAPVAAIRETSILFATAYAALFLREHLRPLHWIAGVVATLGVMLLRLG